MKAPTEARPHKDAKYCWTCKRSIAPSHWGRHQKSAAHGRRVLGIPHPDGRPVKTQHGNSAAEAANSDTQRPDPLPTPSIPKTPPTMLILARRRQTRYRHPGPMRAAVRRDITPGSEYHRDVPGNCLPPTGLDVLLATTRPLSWAHTQGPEACFPQPRPATTRASS